MFLLVVPIVEDLGEEDHFSPDSQVSKIKKYYDTGNYNRCNLIIVRTGYRCRTAIFILKVPMVLLTAAFGKIQWIIFVK
jgi:hypothetical protein